MNELTVLKSQQRQRNVTHVTSKPKRSLTLNGGNSSPAPAWNLARHVRQCRGSPPPRPDSGTMQGQRCGPSAPSHRCHGTPGTGNSGGTRHGRRARWNRAVRGQRDGAGQFGGSEMEPGSSGAAHRGRTALRTGPRQGAPPGSGGGAAALSRESARTGPRKRLGLVYVRSRNSSAKAGSAAPGTASAPAPAEPLPPGDGSPGLFYRGHLSAGRAAPARRGSGGARARVADGAVAPEAARPLRRPRGSRALLPERGLLKDGAGGFGSAPGTSTRSGPGSRGCGPRRATGRRGPEAAGVDARRVSARSRLRPKLRNLLRERGGGDTQTQALSGVPGEQEAGGHCAPPPPSATGGEQARRGGRGRCRPAAARTAEAALLPRSIGPAKAATSLLGPSSVSGCRLSGSAPGPRPGGGGGVPPVSRAEPVSAAGPPFKAQHLRARRAEAPLARSTARVPAGRLDAGEPGGLCGQAETEPSRGLAARRPLPALEGLSPVSGRARGPPGGPVSPAGAASSSFQRRREPEPRRGRREQVASPPPSQRTQAARKRAWTQLMGLYREPDTL
ncbi:collagen alpha-1(I) chain-like [Pipra filicauda]|uniref:Collagen alpha-1(I) chain-like n=1 Tax=Pipra filicauda TaxID=649802 RepID=A0A7R5K1I5_9PASS|nr:collagen alpha-1(I) chain-like [Pipra filicauda]